MVGTGSAETIRVADEAWIAIALLHREHPERKDFTIKEIVDRARTERLSEPWRPAVGQHVSYHCVANKPPRPGQYRMLFETSPGRRRLYREGDPADPMRKGKILPAADAIPAQYRYLLEWYRTEYAPSQPAAWLDAVKELAGTGREIVSGIDADESVRSLREGWR